MSLFETASAQEVLSRLENISASTPANWGKMNAAQMMAHCRRHSKLLLWSSNQERTDWNFIWQDGQEKIIQRQARARKLTYWKEFYYSRRKRLCCWKGKTGFLHHSFCHKGYLITACVHPFFGKMSSQEWAVLGDKHLDHHLKQFGVWWRISTYTKLLYYSK